MPELAADSTPDAPIITGGSDQQTPDGIHHMRALQVNYNTANKFYELESGDLLIRDVPLLAEGEWTDSAQKTPLFYPAKTLEAYAGNWVRRTGYNRHMGGVPRDESNRVSEAINPHFGHFTDEEGNTHAAVISDLLVYGSTPSGRAMQELIKRKNIRYVSVEHGGDEAENPQTRRMEASSLVFGGFAFVNKGACKVCRLNEAPAEDTTPAPVAVPVEETMDTKELEAQIATQGTLIKELSETIKAQKPVEVKAEIPKELEALPGMIKELSAKVDAQAAQIKALEQDGTPATGAGITKELGAVEHFAAWNPKDGTVSGVI